MPGNRGAFRIGILFLCIAILDGVGTEVHFPKKYRNYKDLRVWQKKTNDTRYYHNNRFNVIALFTSKS